jgi:hypothetical protein
MRTASAALKKPRATKNKKKPTHLQDARHDRALGEVAVKELVVNRDVLVADGVLLRLELDDAVDEQEGVAAVALAGEGRR